MGRKLRYLQKKESHADVGCGHEMNLLKIQISVTAPGPKDRRRKGERTDDATRIVRNAYYMRWIKHCPTVVAVNLP